MGQWYQLRWHDTDYRDGLIVTTQMVPKGLWRGSCHWPRKGNYMTATVARQWHSEWSFCPLFRCLVRTIIFVMECPPSVVISEARRHVPVQTLVSSYLNHEARHFALHSCGHFVTTKMVPLYHSIGQMYPHVAVCG